jgi:hypothetical protein
MEPSVGQCLAVVDFVAAFELEFHSHYNQRGYAMAYPTYTLVGA